MMMMISRLLFLRSILGLPFQTERFDLCSSLIQSFGNNRHSLSFIERFLRTPGVISYCCQPSSYCGSSQGILLSRLIAYIFRVSCWPNNTLYRSWWASLCWDFPILCSLSRGASKTISTAPTPHTTTILSDNSAVCRLFWSLWSGSLLLVILLARMMPSRG